jgi:hypothetical protein
VLDRLQQIDQGPAQPVDQPRHDDVEPAPAGILSMLSSPGRPRPLAPLMPASR